MTKFTPGSLANLKHVFDKDTVMAASAAVESLVKWNYCDCGCPQQRSPADQQATDFLRIAAILRVELLS